jgi:fumarate hydratase subunit beta
LNKIELPVSAGRIAELKVGDLVSVSGVMVTARDAAHKYLIENFVDRDPPPEEKPYAETLIPILGGGIIYHCGPVVEKDERGKWRFVAAGPTTSIREEPYQGRIIERFGLRGVMGKGGMGEKTLEACEKHKAVYLHAVGGAASLLAANVVEVLDVMKIEEFGLPEAFWVIRVEDFNAVVTMDSHGNSLHKDVQERSTAILHDLVQEIRDGKS